MNHSTSDRLKDLLEPVITSLGYEFVGHEYHAGNQILLRVYIDRESGISADDCQKVSRQISSLFDVEDPISGQYTLEVSSPGMDRPLFSAQDFERYAGDQVKLELVVPQEGRKRFKGVLLGMREEQVILQVEDTEYALSLVNIKFARIIPQW